VTKSPDKSSTRRTREFSGASNKNGNNTGMNALSFDRRTFDPTTDKLFAKREEAAYKDAARDAARYGSGGR
jgi:hypothetical protein